jgi:DNA repair photolyase
MIVIIYKCGTKRTINTKSISIEESIVIFENTDVDKVFSMTTPSTASLTEKII